MRRRLTLLAMALLALLPLQALDPLALQEEPRAVVEAGDDYLLLSSYLLDVRLEMPSARVVEVLFRTVDGERIAASPDVSAPLALVVEGSPSEALIEWSLVETFEGPSVARAVLESGEVDGLVYTLTIESYPWAPMIYVRLDVYNASSEPRVMITDLGGPAILVPYASAENASWRAAYSSLRAGETVYERLEIEGEVKEPVSALKGFIAVEEVDGEASAFVGFTPLAPSPFFLYVNPSFEYSEETTAALLALVAPVDAVNPGERKTVIEAYVSIGDYTAYNLYASQLVDEALTLYPGAGELVTDGFGFEETIEELRGRIEDLNSLVDDLRERVGELEKRVSELEGENSYLRARISDYEKRALEAEERLQTVLYAAPGAFAIGVIAGVVGSMLARRR